MHNLVPGLIATTVLGCIIAAASWRIASKAGYNPAISLLMIVSPVNLVLVLVFAFREWPIERRLRLQGPQS